MNHYNKQLKNFARANRKAGNLSEALLWNELKQRKMGVQFKRQRPIGNYIADFYCAEKNLVIEIDGWSHDNKYHYDKARDEREKLVTKRKQLDDQRILEAYHASDKTTEEIVTFLKSSDSPEE